jgi:membrane associated rhomboid family serine protease
LLAANVAVFVFVEAGWTGSPNKTFATEFGLIPAVLVGLAERPAELAQVPGAATLLSYSFCHGDVWHLLGNMLFLWVFGPNVEDALGHLRFLAFYCLAAIGGGLAHVIAAPGSEAPLIGASGAIAGVVAAYFILTPFAKVWMFRLGRITVRLRALWVLGLWMAVQIYSALAGAGNGQIAWWTHVGGFVAGALLAVFLRRGSVPLFASATPAAAVDAPEIEGR